MRVGLLGVGRLGSFFARVLADHPQVDSLLLAGSRPDSALALAAELGAAAAPGAAEVIGDVEAVVIAAATDAHPSLIHLAADARLPTFCEKPISLDLGTTDEVIDHVRTAGIDLQVGLHRRFDHGYREARHRVAAGDLGEVYLLRMASHDPAPAHEAFIPTSGGIFRDMLLHDFDVAHFVTGQEIEEVYAAGGEGFAGVSVYEKYGDVGIAAGLLRLSGGALGIFSATRHDPVGHDVRLEVFGSGDSIAVGWDARTPLHSVEEGVPASPEPPYASFLDRFAAAYRAEMDAFLAMAQGQADNPCPPEEARRAFRVAVAAERSRAEQRPVRLAELD